MNRPLHFTIGTGLGFHPTVEQLSLENDLLLVKAGLLYADRVRLCSISSALALDFYNLMGASHSQQLDFLEKYFAAVAPTNPDAAAAMREFFPLYRDLRGRKRGTLSKAEIQFKFEIQAGFTKAWTKFEDGIGEFLRVAGADGIVEAVVSICTASRLAEQRGSAGWCQRTRRCQKSSSWTSSGSSWI